MRHEGRAPRRSHLGHGFFRRIGDDWTMTTISADSPNAAALRTILHGRRAVRSYTSTAVDRETIDELIADAVSAPSAINRQPWAFAVFQGAALLDRFGREAAGHLEQLHAILTPEARARMAEPNAIFHGASTLVVICATSNDRQAAEDCCLAAENFMLAAHALGLGTCPIGSAREWLELPETRARLGLGALVPVFPIVVGYPAAVPPAPGRNAPVVLRPDVR
jgi:nitroreductase